MATTIYSAQVVGLEAQPISVEVDISPGLHIFSIVGLADKEVQESRERISAAIRNIGALPPHKKSQRVIINLAPADIKKEGPAFDLPIALGYLLASGQLSFSPQGKLFLGELGLGGELRKIRGVLPITMVARAAGFTELFVPSGNGSEAAAIEGIRVFEAGHISDIIEHLAERVLLHEHPPTTLTGESTGSATDLKNIRGQESAKRALEIAAAGGHNILMQGPPGAGKTILAQALPSILPPLSRAEALDVSKIYSIAGLLDGTRPFAASRPFRNPHHTSSHTAIIGGGTYPRPGEVTLAHRGVLFLDEFPEYDRRVIEALREPLESRSITVARSKGVETFPADFLLVAAMNPCPCGNLGNPTKECICPPGVAAKYGKKISGPMRDRIDLHVETRSVEYDKLEGEEGEPSEAIRARVLRARDIQKERFKGLPVITNAHMGLVEIKTFVPVSQELKPVLRMAHDKYAMSARSYHRLLKVSRTIADLEGSQDIRPDHVLEALRYRATSET